MVPAGGIIPYHGSTVPDGWAICDGKNNTPDLTDRFILGTSPASKKSWLSKMPASGGSWTIDQDQMPTHNHEQTGNPTAINFSRDDSWIKKYGLATETGLPPQPALPPVNTENAGCYLIGIPPPRCPYIQPYYKLMYIMKLDPKNKRK